MTACSAGVAELCLRGKVSLGCSADTETGRDGVCWWCARRGRGPAGAGLGTRVEMPRDGEGEVVDEEAARRRRSSARLARRRARSIGLGLWGAAGSGGGRRKEAASAPDEKSGCGRGSGGVIWLAVIYRRAHSEKERKGGLRLCEWSEVESTAREGG
jgi:hypothetical protein